MNIPQNIVVHHLDNSRSQRIIWLLEELELPYTIKSYKRASNKQAPPELRAVHPLGKAPIITDNGVVVAESGAIVEYLLHKYDRTGKFKPSEDGFVDNAYYSHYTEGSFLPPLVLRLIIHIAASLAPFFVRPIFRWIGNLIIRKALDPAIRKHVKMVESHLENTPGLYVAGGTGPTSGDFMLLFALEGLVAKPKILQTLLPRGKTVEGSSIKAYVDLLHARPAYQKALERGGKYAYA